MEEVELEVQVGMSSTGAETVLVLAVLAGLRGELRKIAWYIWDEDRGIGSCRRSVNQNRLEAVFSFLNRSHKLFNILLLSTGWNYHP